MLPLETLQRMMTASILSATSSRLGSELEAGKASPLGRLEIYRNNTLISLTEALKANFPVTVRLVDERFFRWVAQDFIRHHPPREPRLALYGAALPAFLATVPACRTVPYVAEVARLEWAICQSLQAEQLNPCSTEPLSGLGVGSGCRTAPFSSQLCNLFQHAGRSWRSGRRIRQILSKSQTASSDKPPMCRSCAMMTGFA